jgi:hypothetical protein
MKKLGTALLLVFLLAVAYFFGTMQARNVVSIPSVEWTSGSSAGEAWREFTASLEAAGATVFGGSKTESERLQGLHYLAQLASASLEMKLAKGSNQAPAFTDWMSDHRKFLGDSPDAVYHTAELSPDFRYQITGNRGDAEYIGFMLYGTQLNGWNRGAANLSSELMHFDANGDFRIVIAKEAPAEGNVNWLPMEQDIHMVMVRQYYHGRDGKTLARLNIVNLDDPAHRPLSDQSVASGLRDAATFFNETLNGAVALGKMLASHPNQADPPKTFNPAFGGVFYPTFDNEYFGSWFYLEENEALVIEGQVPTVDYWSISLQNRWMQSLDYQRFQVGLNNQQIVTENGRYRVVIAHRKPPGPNWIDTAGTREGLLAIRYQLSRDSSPPSLQVVKFSDL